MLNGQISFDFDGETFKKSFDGERLSKQFDRVFNVMKSGRWMTLEEISLRSFAPAVSVSARIRDFRKPKFGAHTVERRRKDETRGVWEYRLIVS